MCFHGSLGYVQIASDFRIVTALKQQIDDLLLPGCYWTNLLFHALHLTGRARPNTKRQIGNQGPIRARKLGSLCTPLGASARPIYPSSAAKV
jgi:hypothetical protein